MNGVALHGAEQVGNAARRIESAAEDMNRAVGNLDDVLQRHRLFMEDWLQRFEQILTDNKP